MSESDDAVLEFAEVVRRLRAECPWKASQTHRSLTRYLLEETQETVEALDAGDAAHLREELGDLLLQVFLHTAIAEQAGEFTLGDVAADATAKMVRRNPHVLGPEAGDGSGREGLTPAEVNEEWERRKAAEKSSRSSVLDGLPPGLPALLLADKVLDRLARAGRPVTASAPLPPSDPTGPDEVGEQLLALVARSRLGGIDPEQALRDAVRRLVADADQT
ncbi:MAG: Nucleoside triphosphate pyrophosphohydrolase MazG [uncultured Nocardioides sp.]|uniref:Nucleoside triphosphate pyrophosphohydrolase MazG n=1 Tax=uncultured Nocardioides sp. TaxID=198441 RepID=A0A6J4N367_9ACTN|nr:MAG: Nucleoside triphosphate pyrophosphohydrolase MazG [uncultured Nocardioides sp.]